MNTSIQHTVFALSLALLLPGSLMAGETSDQTRTRKEAIQLTQRIESSARKIQNESEHLSVMQKNGSISNFSHQYKLHTVAIEINEQLQPALKRLAEIQPALPAWHGAAVDRMRISGANLTANANAAVLNRGFSGTRQPVILDTEYGQLLQNINTQAEALVQVADATGDYGNAQLKGHQAGLAIASHD
jgi:hypothetical protein